MKVPCAMDPNPGRAFHISKHFFLEATALSGTTGGVGFSYSITLRIITALPVSGLSHARSISVIFLHSFTLPLFHAHMYAQSDVPFAG